MVSHIECSILIFLHITCCNICVITGAQCSESYIKKDTYIREHRYLVLHGIGFEMCIETCKIQGKCWSVNYDHSTFSCELIDEIHGSFSTDRQRSFARLDKEEKKCDSSQCHYYETCQQLTKGKRTCLHNGSSSCLRSMYIGSLANVAMSGAWPSFRDPFLDSSTGWMSNDDKNEYIEFSFDSTWKFLGITTKGLQGLGIYVSSYKVKYWYSSYRTVYDSVTKTYRSVYYTEWRTVKDGFSQDHVFVGNADETSPVTNFFFHPTRARVIRLYPQTWNGSYVGLRMDVLGCNN